MRAAISIARCCRRLRYSLLALAFGAAVLPGRAQYLEPPQQTATGPRIRYIRFDVEAEQSHQTGSAAGSSSTSQRLYLSPVLGIAWDYFIYHPDLVNFQILAEPGYVWQKSGPSGALTTENDFLLTGNFSATLLQLKPYSTTIYANASHDTHQYDFFNTVTEDVKSYGALTGYRTGPVPVTLAFDKTYRDTTGFDSHSKSDQATLNLHAQNERKEHDFTEFSYQYNDYNNTYNDSNQKFADSSSFHYVTLTDTEHFTRSVLDSSVLYNHADTDGSPSDAANAMLNYSYEHTPQLRSLYDYTFSRFANQGGDTVINFGRAGLQHQLYESLQSSADIHGSHQNSTFQGAKLDLSSVGTDVGLNYTKRLGTWGRLFIGNSATFDFTDQESSGTSVFIANEPHTLVSGVPARLDQPRVITIVSVTTTPANGNIPLTENLDYTVDRSTDPWQIQIVPTSLIIVSPAQVLVNYTVEPNPSGSYTTFSDQPQIRLDLWDGMVGIYARYNYTENHANDPGFVLEDIREVQVGADFSRRGWRFNANYTDRKSSFFDYYAYSLSEGYSGRLTAESSLGVDLHQRWSFYPNNNGSTNVAEEVDFYDFMIRYDWHPLHNLEWAAEGGYQIQRGQGLNQDLFVARTYVKWLVGKLDIHLGYEYQNQQYTAQKRDRNFVFVRMTRSF
jgi:hypothetical protein